MARSDKGAQFSDARNFTKFNDLRHRTTGAQMGMHPNPPPSPPARPRATTRTTRRQGRGAGRQKQHGHTSRQTSALPPTTTPAPAAPLFGHPTQAQPYTLAAIPTAQPQPQHANGHIAHAQHVTQLVHSPTANASSILQSHDAQMADGVHGPVHMPVATGSRGGSHSTHVHPPASAANQLSTTKPSADSVLLTSTSKGNGNPGADSDILRRHGLCFETWIQEAAAYLAQANVGQSTLAGETGIAPNVPAAIVVATATAPTPIDADFFVAAVLKAAQVTASGTGAEEPLAQPKDGITTAEAAVQPAIRTRVRPREDDDGPEGEREPLLKRVKLTVPVDSENVQKAVSNKTDKLTSQALDEASGAAEAPIVPSHSAAAALEMNISADTEKIGAQANASTAVAKDRTGDDTEKASTKEQSEKIVSPSTVTPEEEPKVNVAAVKNDNTAKADVEKKANVTSTDVPSDKAANKPASALAQSLKVPLAAFEMATDVGNASDEENNLDDLLRVDLDVFKSDNDADLGKDKTPCK